MWYNKCVDLLTVSVTARESAGEPYTLVEIAGEADVTNTDELRRLLDDEVSQQPRYTGAGKGPSGCDLCRVAANRTDIGFRLHVYPPWTG